MRKFFRYIQSSDAKYILALALLCLFGYWQIGFMVHPMKWDMMDYFFPSRYIIGEMLQQHLLPLWNPYQLLGYPICADPQSGAWYPITWFLGLINGYSINMINFEYLLHLFLAGWGMFELGKTLGYQRTISFLLGVAYLFSGFMIGNAQHLSWIISATWLPFVIAGFITLSKEKSLVSASKLSFFGFLMLTGGYPAFLFVLTYFLLFLLIYFSILEYREGKIKGMLHYYKYVFLAFSILMVCSSIVVVSNYYLIPELTRSAGISASKALFSPFSPQCMISFFAPLSVVFNGEFDFFQADLSMTNGYFGILLFVFLIAGLWIKKPPIQWLFLSFALLSLLISFGSYTPLRMFLYDYIPLMNLFRFPSLFRLFFIMFFLISSGFALEQIFVVKKKIPVSIFIVSILLILGMSSFILFIRSQEFLGIKSFITQDLFVFSTKSTFQQHFVFHAAIQIILLLTFLFILMKFKATQRALRLICVLVSIEMAVSTQLTAPYTVFDTTISNAKYQAYLNTMPSRFPIPKKTPVILNEPDSKKGCPLWRNTCIYNKTISHEGFNPFKLNTIKYLEDSLPVFFNTFLNNPTVYLSNSIFPSSQLKIHTAHNLYDSAFIYLDDKAYEQNKPIATFDTILGSAEIVQYLPNKIGLSVNTVKGSILVLQQNRFPGWQVSINGARAELLTVNTTTMGVRVPSGNSMVVFEYAPNAIYIGYGISILGFAVLSIFLLITAFRKIRKKYRQ